MARWGRIALTAAVAGVIVAAFLTKDGMPKRNFRVGEDAYSPARGFDEGRRESAFKGCVSGG